LNISELKILFLTPYYHQNRGNSTTAKRLEHGFREAAIKLTIFAYEEETITREMERQMKEADMFHILQFARFTNWCEKNDFQLNKPYIITSGGTDINHSLKENEEKYLPILQKAKSISVFTHSAKKALINDFGFGNSDIHVIPQSIYFPDQNSYMEKLDFPEGFPKILLPAGLRPVKDVLFAVETIRKLQMDYPDIIFLVLGANLDDQVFKEIEKAKEKYDWFHYKPDIDLSLMEKVYQWADIVVNTSLSEGQSTSLLEAMAVKTPVVARDIPGNASIIVHEVNGLLFKDHNDMYNALNHLLTDRDFCKKMISNGYQTVRENHTIEQEIDAYIKMYTQQGENPK
jgi:glycosyltransferase involved in cell wall biosynthesis